MLAVRRQLTLFIENEIIDHIRIKFNPIQHALIAAHVTLCREDELENLEEVIKNIKSLKTNHSISITFNNVERFENGKGVFMPGKAENINFYTLRNNILESPRKHLPHITLMHPRNSTCTDSIFEEIKSYPLPTLLTFRKISLIEQKNGGIWEVLAEFPL